MKQGSRILHASEPAAHVSAMLHIFTTRPLCACGSRFPRTMLVAAIIVVISSDCVYPPAGFFFASKNYPWLSRTSLAIT